MTEPIDYECADCRASALLEKRILTNSGCLKPPFVHVGGAGEQGEDQPGFALKDEAGCRGRAEPPRRPEGHAACSRQGKAQRHGLTRPL